jgi:Ni/Co efflux regulator RcnB
MKISRSFWKLALVVLLSTALLPSAFAQGKGHGNGKGKSKGQSQASRDRDNDRDDDRDRDNDRDKDRGSLLGSTNTSRPPGWSKGKKTGWGNCDVPPGQVKKYGCHPNSNLLEQARRERDRIRRESNRTRTWPTGTIAPAPTNRRDTAPTTPAGSATGTVRPPRPSRDRAEAERDSPKR